MKNSSLLFIFSLVVLGATALSSCKKEKPTVVIIEVRDSENLVVGDASVRLFGLPTPVDPDSPEAQIEHGELRLDTTVTTNGAGKVTIDYSEFYELGQSGLFVLDIEASKGLLFGEGIIKVEPEEETQKLVVIE